MSTKLLISSLISSRVGISWLKVKPDSIRSAVQFSSVSQSTLHLNDCVRPVPVGTSTTDELDTQVRMKMDAYRRIMHSVMEKSFTNQEEKYQQKLSQIIEIFYSLDESMRPTELTAGEVDYMVKMKKHKQIRNYIKKLAKVEARKKSMNEAKLEVKEAIYSKPKPAFGIVFNEDTGRPEYKVHNVNPICSWTITKRMRQLQYARIARAKVLDPPKVIIDFDYDHHMTAKQHLTITAQVKVCIGISKGLDEPVALYFCNFKPESPVARYLELELGSLSSHMIEATSKSYFDLFPKDRLVYLTADTDQVLDYDPDDVYIIGGMIDTLTNEPLAALKAQREGLRTAKLPLSEHFMIRNEGKSLKIGQVFGIISEMASSRNEDLKVILEKFISRRIQPESETNRLLERYEDSFTKSREMLKNKFQLTEEETEIMILLATYHAHRDR